MNRDRKHIRLTYWDYSSEGIYFVTICCYNRQSFFGRITNNEIILSEIGFVASKYWLEIPDHFPHVKLDEFIVMPNHIHGILILDYSLAGPRHGVALQTPTHDIVVGSCHGMTLHGNKITFDGNAPPGNCITFDDIVASDKPISESNQSKQESNQNINKFSKPVKNSVSVIINQYKSSVKRWGNKNGFNNFQWQTRFYDQILHDENSIDNIREYICNNLKNWSDDELYL